MASITELPALAIGAIDGINQDFTTANQFLPSSLRVWVDGQLVHGADSDGFDITGSNSFRTKVPLEPGTRLQVMYDRA